MLKPSFILLLAIVFQFTAIAQKKLLTVEEASNMNPKLSASTLSQLQWQPRSNEYVYVEKNNLVRGTPATSHRDTLLRLSEMNLLMKQANQDTLKRFPAITFLTTDQFYFTNLNKLFLYDLTNHTVAVENSWREKAENPDIDKAGKLVAYTMDNNLFISKEGKEIVVTDEKNQGIVYGSSRVHRNEFGIEKGTFWSPNGQELAFYRMDETMVTDYPLVDITRRIATVTPTKYPMAGMTSHKVSVGVYSVHSGKTIYLQTDSSLIPDSASRIEYLTNITWSPDGNFIYIATLNRNQNFMQLNESGYIKVNVFKNRVKTNISIENSSTTINDDEILHIFDRFYKSDKSRGIDKKGVGLGLFIVKNILTLHNEKIFVESDKDKFTRFTFTLTNL